MRVERECIVEQRVGVASTSVDILSPMVIINTSRRVGRLSEEAGRGRAARVRRDCGRAITSDMLRLK
jgi:hypothetical protein